LQSNEYLEKLAALQQAAPKLFRMNSQFVALPSKVSTPERHVHTPAPSSPLSASSPGALPSGFKKSSKASTPTKTAPAAGKPHTKTFVSISYSFFLFNRNSIRTKESSQQVRKATRVIYVRQDETNFFLL